MSNHCFDGSTTRYVIAHRVTALVLFLPLLAPPLNERGETGAKVMGQDVCCLTGFGPLLPLSQKFPTAQLRTHQGRCGGPKQIRQSTHLHRLANDDLKIPELVIREQFAGFCAGLRKDALRWRML